MIWCFLTIRLIWCGVVWKSVLQTPNGWFENMMIDRCGSFGVFSGPFRFSLTWGEKRTFEVAILMGTVVWEFGQRGEWPVTRFKKCRWNPWFSQITLPSKDEFSSRQNNKFPLLIKCGNEKSPTIYVPKKTTPYVSRGFPTSRFPWPDYGNWNSDIDQNEHTRLCPPQL